MRRMLAMFVLGVFSFVLVACSDDPAPTEPPPPPPDPTVTSVEISPEDPVVEENESFPLEAEVLDQDGNPMPDAEVVWTSDDESVATVDADGVLTGVSEGQATIGAEVEDVSDQITVQVAAEGSVVDEEGGTVESEDGNATVTVPAGALTGRTAIEIEPVDDAEVPAEGFVQGTAYRIGPEGLELEEPATITLRFDDVDVPPEVEPGALRLHREDPDAGVWDLIPGSSVDLVEETVAGQMSGFSVFGVVRSGPTPAVQVVAGDSHTCSLNTAGQAFCWGLGTSGQLGGGEQASSLDPVAVAGGHQFVEISAGGFSTCGRLADGEVWCWGRQMKEETLTDPVFLPEPEPLPGNVTFDEIRLGLAHACGVGTDGNAYCWGDNPQGQLGDGTTGGGSTTPVAVAGGLDFQEVVAGVFTSCGIASGGAAHCWGSNFFGELGNPAVSESPTPVAVDTEVSFRGISAGSVNYCAVSDQDAGWCWGNNMSGQLGDGTTTTRSTPVTLVDGPPSLERVVASHENSLLVHTCGLEQSSGAAWCWGLNDDGQLGAPSSDTCEFNDEDFSCSVTPLQVDGGLAFSDLTLGLMHTCGATPEGDLYCWGDNSQGQFGDGTDLGSTSPVPAATGDGGAGAVQAPAFRALRGWEIIGLDGELREELQDR